MKGSGNGFASGCDRNVVEYRLEYGRFQRAGCVKRRYAIASGVVHGGEPCGRTLTGIEPVGLVIPVVHPVNRRAGGKGNDVGAGESYRRPANGHETEGLTRPRVRSVR